jgi:SAM-dependent methyltransferase
MTKQFLHVGCGPLTKINLRPYFHGPEWREVRFDIDPDSHPDIVGTITDMNAVATESMDAVYSAHNVEHLFPHEVEIALKEFHRVLRPDGFALVTCPDLQAACRLVAEDKLLEPAYTSDVGPISPIDMLYGFRGQTVTGNAYMAHKCGFTRSVLIGALLRAGFRTVAAAADKFALWAIARKQLLPEAEMHAFSNGVLEDKPAR